MAPQENEYEALRRANVARNKLLMEKHSIDDAKKALLEDAKKTQEAKKRREPQRRPPVPRMDPALLPRRVSARMKGKQLPKYSMMDEREPKERPPPKHRSTSPRSSSSHGLREYPFALHSPSREALEEAEEAARKFMAQMEDKGRPCALKCMLSSHVTGGFWLQLPPSFCGAHMPQAPEKVGVDILLEDEHGDSWPVVFLPYKPGLSGGWRGFAIEQELVYGDAVVFVALPCQAGMKFTLKVCIFRSWDQRSAKGDPSRPPLARSRAPLRGKEQRGDDEEEGMCEELGGDTGVQEKAENGEKEDEDEDEEDEVRDEDWEEDEVEDEEADAGAMQDFRSMSTAKRGAGIRNAHRKSAGEVSGAHQDNTKAGGKARMAPAKRKTTAKERLQSPSKKPKSRERKKPKEKKGHPREGGGEKESMRGRSRTLSPPCLESASGATPSLSLSVTGVSTQTGSEGGDRGLLASQESVNEAARMSCGGSSSADKWGNGVELEVEAEEFPYVLAVPALEPLEW